MTISPESFPDDLSQLDEFLSAKEAIYDLKPGAEAQIVWQEDKRYQQTEYAIVYLHGFRASHPEGDPVHKKIASQLGAHLYLSRLEEHGIYSPNPLQSLTEQKLIDYARFSFQVGRKIGRKVILMGTSTGGSLALFLAANSTFRESINSLILYSPLIRFYGFKQKLLQWPLSRKMLSIIPGTSHSIKESAATKAEEQIWNTSYALQGALELGKFISHYMRPTTYQKIHHPVFTGYYYKNKQQQDKVVSVRAIQKMMRKLSTPPKYRKSVSFPHAQTHVICSSLLSQSVANVIKESSYFLKYIGTQ
jgi:esterase/lipase